MTEGRQTRAGAKHDIILFQDREAVFLRLVREQNVYVEVKSDQDCSRGRDTGNVFVEYEQDPRGWGIWKPSGICATTADYWVEEFDYDCWLVTPTSRVRYLFNYWRQHGRTVLGGDFNRHRGVLVPINSIVRPSTHGLVIPSDDARGSEDSAVDIDAANAEYEQQYLRFSGESWPG